MTTIASRASCASLTAWAARDYARDGRMRGRVMRRVRAYEVTVYVHSDAGYKDYTREFSTLVGACAYAATLVLHDVCKSVGAGHVHARVNALSDVRRRGRMRLREYVCDDVWARVDGDDVLYRRAWMTPAHHEL